MPDDKSISNLISQSLRQKLDKEEQLAVEQYLDSNEEAKKFAELSKLIQDSVRGLKVSEETATKAAADTELPEFSNDLRDRLKLTVSAAYEEKLSLSRSGLFQLDETEVDRTNFPERKKAGSCRRRKIGKS